MTKFVLLGGYAHKAPDEGRSFYQELVKDFSGNVRVLMCYFARPEDQWKKTFDEDSAVFQAHVPDRAIRFTLATVGGFKDQLQVADIIYFKGGETLDLEKALNANPGWEKLLSGKTVAGTSAGAEILATLSYNLDHSRLMPGYGLVPVSVLPHYDSDYAPNIRWDQIVLGLRKEAPERELVLLREGEFRVFLL